MKKRSIVAALAMLLVSALVLTSATYAWFASGSNAQVNAITTQVQNSDGSLLVAANNAAGYWKTLLTYADFNACQSKTFNADGLNTLYPVDCKIGNTGVPVFYDCLFDGVAYGGSAGATTADASHYVSYTYYIKADNSDGEIELNPAASAETSPSGEFMYGLVHVTGGSGANAVDTYAVFSSDTSGDTYTPFSGTGVKAVEKTAVDAPTDNPTLYDGNVVGVIDRNEVTAGQLVAVGSEVTATNPASIAFNSKAGVVYTVNVYVWAEGQDAECVGAAHTSGYGIGFTPAFTAATATP